MRKTGGAAAEQLRACWRGIEELVRGVFLVRELSPRTLALLLARHEIAASRLLADYLQDRFAGAAAIDPHPAVAAQCFGSLSAPTILIEETRRVLQQWLARRRGICVIPGGVIGTEDGQTSWLGDGGADYSAAVLAAALGAAEVEIWTGVDGIMTADPEKVSKAFTIPCLSYEEAMELSHFGAKVLFPRAMQPAFEAGIALFIRNLQKPEQPGTIISAQPPASGRAITGISSISGVVLMRLEGSGMLGVAGVARRLFDALSRRGISIILISQASSEHSICFAITPSSAEAAREAIEHEFALEMRAHEIEPVLVETGLSVIAVVGSRMRNTPGIAGRLFQALGRNGINVSAIAQGSSELNISVVIRESDEAKALNAVHDALFLSDCKTVNLFVLGTGKIGGELLEQLSRQREQFAALKLDLRVPLLGNSKAAIIDSDGIALENWREKLRSSPTRMQPAGLVAEIRRLNLPNSIFVDCTASAEVAACYIDLLGSSVSVVTPNKKANSGRLDAYRTLRQRASSGNVKFFYETTVGAGLPIIGTLNDLILSGDEILRIDAVLSGTLSYIFNTFCGGKLFSSVVSAAREKGYTEPDPRDDLSGTDVARKLLILAREMGLPLELEDIAVESLVPANCRGAGTVGEFFARLAESDHLFSERQQAAETAGCVLRYIGSIMDGRAEVSLQAVGPEHPFYTLSGSDNVISFRTRRYCDRPLVVKGPGAGIEVTAAGVLADIIRAAGYIAQT